MVDAIDLLELCVRREIIDAYEMRGDRVCIIQGTDRHVLSPERAAVFARGVLRHADTLNLLASRVAQLSRW